MKYLLLGVLLFPAIVFAQPTDYWQQHVSYKIEGTLIDSNHSFDGHLSVVYTNNSPETLHEVYFHLYANAFKPGSMMHKRAKEQGDWMVNKFKNFKPSDQGNYKIDKISAGGSDVVFEISGTIMKVKLAKPLAPKSNVTIAFDFFEQIPRQTRRSGWMNADSIKYSLAQWYPKVCEYDREGWHHQEYVSREFYGVWGEFDVTLTVPAQFCVGATGQCQNPNEVGWGYDQIANGVKKGKVYPSSEPKRGMTKWNFKASNVHDFAWVAHEYIHEWDTWMDTVTVHCLYKKTEEKYWSEAMKNTFAMLDHHSNKVGWYQYRNFYNTHAGDGGMEYPQLIMDGSPNAGLIMHEGGHQWFYGMIGSNETRYAYLDEGFTEFIEMRGMEWYYGRHNERSPYRDTSWLTEMFIPEYDSRRNYYGPYLNLATSGYEEPLTIPHDWARENANAGQVYFKTLNGLAQLEYVLGDSVFWAGMKEYFRRWHFKHPNLNDFKRAMEDVSRTDLDWYFDQWFGSTRTIDYGVCGVSSDKQDNGTYKTRVELYHCDLGVAPIDLTLHYDDGTTGVATIPLAVNQGMAYQKPEAGRIFFPSWDWVESYYEGSTTTPKEVCWVEIDSSYRLMDLNRRDNTSGLFPKIGNTKWSLLKQWQNYPPLSGTYGVLRPIIWYEEPSKINLGLGLLFGNNRNSNGDFKIILKTDPKREGHDYLLSTVDSLYHGSFAAQTPKWHDYFDVELKYTKAVKWLGNLTSITFDAKKMYGLMGVSLSLDHIIRPNTLSLGPTNTIGFFVEASDRGATPNYAYPVFYQTIADGLNVTSGLKYSFVSHNGNTKVIARIEQGFNYIDDNATLVFPWPETYRSFGLWSVTGSQEFDLFSHSVLSLRLSAVSSWGSLPNDRIPLLNGGNSYDQVHSTFWQGITSINRHFSKESHFFLEGGAGVRGYDPATGRIGYTNSALGFSTEWSFGSLGIVARSFSPMLFFDAGWVGTSLSLPSIQHNLYTNAGIGFRWNILSWLPWQLEGVAEEYVEIPTIGLYFPFYMNHPDDGKEHFAFRYAISLGTSFKL